VGFAELRRLRRRPDLGPADRLRAAVDFYDQLRAAGSPAGLADSERQWCAALRLGFATGQEPGEADIERFLADCERMAAAALTEPLAVESLVGTVVGSRYLIEGVIGEGSSGVVYRARHVETFSPVAVKILHPSKVLRRHTIEQLDDPFAYWDELVGRFRREARAQASLHHPGIATVFDFGAEGAAFYQAIEFLPGVTLRDAAAAEGPMETGRATSIIIEVARAVDVAHGRGVVHRDLKPANVFLCRYSWGEAVKVLDFGIAKLLRDAEVDATLETAEGTFLGTVRYASPEQFALDEVSAASDVYSLAVMLFELLAGRPPFEGSASALSLKHTMWDAPHLSDFRPDVARRLGDIIQAAMAKDPAARPARAGDLARLLVDCEGSAGRGTAQIATQVPAVAADTPELPDDARRAARILVERITDECPDLAMTARRQGDAYRLLADRLEPAWRAHAARFPDAACDHFYAACVALICGGDAALFVAPASAPR